MHANPQWLFGIVEDGVVAAGGARDVEVELEASFEDRRRLLGALVDGARPATLMRAAGLQAADAESLIEGLREAGALVDGDNRRESLPGKGLGDATIAAARDEPVGRFVWTADELLVLPERADPSLVRRAVRAFLSGLGSDARLRAYCYVAVWLEPTTWGDLPRADLLDERRREAEHLDPAAVHVVDLNHASVASAEAGRIGALGAGRPHRLGTVLSESEFSISGPLHHAAAVYPVPNLRHPMAVSTRVGVAPRRMPSGRS